jgi:VIT1/CCC1 family predicted Fe2+/Mn2+ transporter
MEETEIWDVPVPRIIVRGAKVSTLISFALSVALLFIAYGFSASYELALRWSAVACGVSLGLSAFIVGVNWALILVERDKEGR